MEIYKKKKKKKVRHFLIQKAEKKNKWITNERKTGAYENMTELLWITTNLSLFLFWCNYWQTVYDKVIMNY